MLTLFFVLSALQLPALCVPAILGLSVRPAATWWFSWFAAWAVVTILMLTL